jgi:hypothetical protein
VCQACAPRVLGSCLTLKLLVRGDVFKIESGGIEQLAIELAPLVGFCYRIVIKLGRARFELLSHYTAHYKALTRFRSL